MESKEMGIKESKELLSALGKLAKAGVKIGEDKKVNLEDLKHVADLASEMKMLIDGFTGLDMVDDEIKDLSQEEAVELLLLVFKEIKGAKQ